MVCNCLKPKYVSVRTLTGTFMVRAFVCHLKYNEHINSIIKSNQNVTRKRRFHSILKLICKINLVETPLVKDVLVKFSL